MAKIIPRYFSHQQVPKSSFLTFLSFTILITLFYSHLGSDSGLVYGIKCYVCQSNIDPKCADPFDNSTLPITDCDAYPRADLAARNELEIAGERGFFSAFSQSTSMKPLRATMCRKIRQKANGQWRTIRGCGYIDPPTEEDNSNLANNCEMRYGTSDVIMESCSCNNKDGCNSSPTRSGLNPLTVKLMVAISSLLLPLVAHQDAEYHLRTSLRS